MLHSSEGRQLTACFGASWQRWRSTPSRTSPFACPSLALPRMNQTILSCSGREAQERHPSVRRSLRSKWNFAGARLRARGAVVYADRGVRRALRQSLQVAFCQGGWHAVHVFRGRWTEAKQLLEATVEVRRWSAGARGTRRLRRRQGRTADATGLLDTAGPSGSARAVPAQLALTAGTREAIKLLEPLLAQALAKAGLSLDSPRLAVNPRRRSWPSADRRLSKGPTLRCAADRPWTAPAAGIHPRLAVDPG